MGVTLEEQGILETSATRVAEGTCFTKASLQQCYLQEITYLIFLLLIPDGYVLGIMKPKKKKKK